MAFCFFFRTDSRGNPPIALLAFEREKSRDSRALDCGSEKSLMRRARAAHSAGQDFAAFGNVFLQTVYVLIIDLVDFFLTESAHLFAGHFLETLFNGSFFFHNKNSLTEFVYPRTLKRGCPSRRRPSSEGRVCSWRGQERNRTIRRCRPWAIKIRNPVR